MRSPQDTYSFSDANSTSPMRVLLYSRVSSSHQAQRGMSIEAQPKSLRSWAQSQGWRVVGELTDAGRTGRNSDRGGFNSLMRALRIHKPDAVLVTKLSRFMRNARQTLNTIHHMRELGVALICKDEPIDTRQRGIADMFLAILATMAEWESDRLSEYAKDNYKLLVSKGRWPSGSPPYGYRYDKEQGELLIVQEEADVVRLIYSLYVNRRMGMHSIRKELSARGTRTPNGGTVWSLSRLWHILSDGTYIGQHRLGIAAPCIIVDDLFDKAQRLRRTNKRLHPPRKDPWPLQNRLRCTVCGSTFKCTYSKGKRFYRCSGRWRSSQHYLQTGEQCTMSGLGAEALEESLLVGICNSMFKPENFASALEASIDELRSKAYDMERDVEPLKVELTEVSEELSRIEMAWVRGRIGKDELRRLEREALDRRERLQARLDTLDQGDLLELERTQRLIRAAEKSLEMARSSGERWESRQAPPMWFTDALVAGRRPDDELSKVDESEVSGEEDPCVYDTFPEIPPERIASTLGVVLDRIQAEVYAEPGRLKVQGVINLEVPPSESLNVPGHLIRYEEPEDNQAFSDAGSSE